MMYKKDVIIYTDGACSNNPGKGGIGIVMIYKGLKKEFSEGYKMTTNNRMELLAVVKALEFLKESCNVQVYSDSKYVVDSVNKKWVYNWEKQNWIKKGTPVVNNDLWKKLLLLLKEHNVTFNWVKGHSDNAQNNLCDYLATNAILKSDLQIDKGYIK